MLILQRKLGESIVIGDNIVVSIADISSDRVKISIDAPKEISIIRSELLAAVDSNREAAQASKKSISILKDIFKNKP